MDIANFQNTPNSSTNNNSRHKKKLNYVESGVK
jgi:hypothetical protein